MADHNPCFRPARKPTVDENQGNSCMPHIVGQTESNDSSFNLSVSWIDVESTPSKEHDGRIDSQATFDSKEELVKGSLDIIVDDRHSGDPLQITVSNEKINEKTSNTFVIGGDSHHEQQETQQEQQFTHQKGTPNQGKFSNVPKAKGPYVEIIDTHYESAEGYDWDGILDLRNQIKKQQEQQQQHDVTAVQWVTEFRLYLTDGILEQATEEASLALDGGPHYEVLDDRIHRKEDSCHQHDSSDSEDKIDRSKNDNDEDDFVKFVECSKRVVGIDVEPSSNDSSEHNNTEDEEEYTSLSLSPLDVLTNSLLGTKAFHRNHHHHSVRLTELIVGGPSLKLGESSIERLASALAGGGSGALRNLVLNVSAVDLTAMNALGDCIRATCDSLEDFHFYTSQTTKRLVASRSRYKNVPAPSVLGPGISCWVDAWTSNPQNKLQSLNISRMDIGDEAAFALSRLLLSAPRLKILNLAQDDFYASSKTSYSQERDNDETSHPSLSFAGTKRLLESLILIEDIKSRNRSSLMPLPLSCANLLELDLSGWVLEDEERERNSDGHGDDDDDDDDKAVDNFYDGYNYIDDGSGEDEFEFAVIENGSDSNTISAQNTDRNYVTKRNQRACCVIASMLRVNTTLRKLVLVAEDRRMEKKLYGLSETAHSNRGLLSVRSTLAIARALRDHISVPMNGNNSRNIGKVDDGTSSSRSRPIGSNLRTLILSTDYGRGMTRSKTKDASSWAITERKRAVAKVFYQALIDRPIHQLRLQELSCTMSFKGLEPLGGSPFESTNAAKKSPNNLRDQLEFFLKQNRRINQSLETINSFWLPRLSSLVSTTNPHTTIDDDEDEDCNFVEVVNIDSDSAMISKRDSQKNPPPIMVLVLPTLLAKAGKEASRHDVVFSCSRILARKTNLWEMSSEYRCEPPPRHRNPNHIFMGTRQKEC